MRNKLLWIDLAVTVDRLIEWLGREGIDFHISLKNNIFVIDYNLTGKDDDGHK